VLTLALWSASWVMIGRQMRRSDAFQTMVPATGGPITLARAPGGIARRVTTESVMLIQEVTWSSDSHYLLYLATPELGFGKIMKVSQTSSNPFDIKGNNERMQREMLRMMAPRLQYYDLRTGVAGHLEGTWPPAMYPAGGFALSRDGKYIALVLADYSQINSIEDQSEVPGELYVAPVGQDFVLGQVTHIGTAEQFVWLPDNQRLLYVQESGSQPGTYITNVPDGKPRLLNKVHGYNRPWGGNREQTVAYCTFYQDSPNLVGRQWSLRHLDLRTGKFREVPLKDGPVKLGPLGRSELPVVRQPEDRGESTRIAAVDFATGQIRWLRRDLKQNVHDAHPILGGRALLVKVLASPGNDDDSSPRQFAVLSLSDGKLRPCSQPRLPQGAPTNWYVSPDGMAVALSAASGRMTGLNPFTALRETLWVARLTDTAALLTGPGD